MVGTVRKKERMLLVQSQPSRIADSESVTWTQSWRPEEVDGTFSPTVLVTDNLHGTLTKLRYYQYPKKNGS